MPLFAAPVKMGQPTAIGAGGDTDTPVKPKRTLSEETKQKLKEARERKKQEAAAAKAAEAEQTAEREKAAEEQAAAERAKKEALLAKRREARLKRKQESSPAPATAAPALSEADSEPEKKKKRAPRKEKSPATSSSADQVKPPVTTNGATLATDQPPAWFEKFIRGILEEKHEQRGTKVTKKDLSREASDHAASKWRDGYTRERVRGELDKHTSNMYGMIFG